MAGNQLSLELSVLFLLENHNNSCCSDKDKNNDQDDKTCIGLLCRSWLCSWCSCWLSCRSLCLRLFLLWSLWLLCRLFSLSWLLFHDRSWLFDSWSLFDCWSFRYDCNLFDLSRLFLCRSLSEQGLDISWELSLYEVCCIVEIRLCKIVCKSEDSKSITIVDIKGRTLEVLAVCGIYCLGSSSDLSCGHEARILDSNLVACCNDGSLVAVELNVSCVECWLNDFFCYDLFLDRSLFLCRLESCVCSRCVARKFFHDDLLRKSKFFHSP